VKNGREAAGFLLRDPVVTEEKAFAANSKFKQAMFGRIQRICVFGRLRHLKAGLEAGDTKNQLVPFPKFAHACEMRKKAINGMVNRHGRARIARSFAAILLTLLCQSVSSLSGQVIPAPEDDPYLWLEEVNGTKALDWVRQQNAVSTRELESAPGFEPMRQRMLAILNNKERIPAIAKHGQYCYNF
jgi:Prolyl oligopeptidase, N-terminal beta-propeller domain